MLDHRVYRGALVPALVVLVLSAFSLGSRPPASTTRVAPDAFDGARAAAEIDSLADRFPDRRSGSAGDVAIAERVARAFETSGFAAGRDIGTSEVTADGPDGPVDMRVVVAERQGLSSRRVVVVANRDAAPGAPRTTLSGTAVLLELARVLADRDLRITAVLASVSGADAGHVGVREAVRRAGRPIDAVIVLGDLAADRSRRPWVVPWSLSGAPAPHGLRRTVEAAVRRETGQSPGSVRAVAQWARRAVPVTVSGQGVAAAEGAPAVLLSATGELGPRPGDDVSRRRLRAFGRAVLRAFSAIEGARPEAAGPAERSQVAAGGDGIITLDRLLPGWAVRLAVLGLLLPALVTAVDAFFRIRRRGLPGRRWLTWALSFGLPLILAWAWLRLLDLLGAHALSAPAAPGVAGLGAPAAVALASVPVVLLLGYVALRSWGPHPRGVAAGGGAAAVGLLTSILALAVWVANPYAAGVLVPAAHLWLLVPAPESRARASAAVAGVLAGLLLPVLVGAYFVVTLDLGGTEVLRLVFDLLAGGEVGLLDALAISSMLGLAIAALAVVLAGRDARRAAPDEPVRTRGPRTYAGPGSLGGTESALRR